MSLFDDLQKAILDGDMDLVADLRRRIMQGERDESLDKNMIQAIIKKEPGRVIRSIINSDDLDEISCFKACSSLLTHNIIEAQINNRDINDYPINELYIILGTFINDGLDRGKDDFKKFVTKRYKRFI
jgi:hypothetical protein|nr:MAG TPA: hypothetical protein [Herelleviridae sp.]DAQ59501.1 MAG TPA: hypothetical protein [Caudoviricetes sp.]DAT60823.1 MAG TPA: hypothetical protein [Bacteriophage sp.]